MHTIIVESRDAYLESPQCYDTVHHPLLGPSIKVNPYASDCDRYTDNVAVQEGLIEGVPDGRWRLDEKENESNGGLEISLAGLPDAHKKTYHETRHNELTPGD